MKTLRTLAILTAAVAVLAVSCGGQGTPSEEDASEPGANQGARNRGADLSSADNYKSSGSSGSGAATPAAGSSGIPYQATVTDRKIIFSAQMVLASDDVQAAFLAVEQAARAAAGYVERSSINKSSGRDGQEYSSANLTIRVPAENYQGTISALRTIPNSQVEGEDASSTEVTEEYTDLDSRLRNLERSEAQYLTLLEQAKSIQDILIVNERIDNVRSQIEQIKGRLRLLDDLTDLATISVAIHTSGSPVVVAADGGPKSFREAFSGAWHSAQDAAGYIVAAGAVALVAAIWLALPVLVAAAAAFVLARRVHNRAAAAVPALSAAAEQRGETSNTPGF